MSTLLRRSMSLLAGVALAVASGAVVRAQTPSDPPYSVPVREMDDHLFCREGDQRVPFRPELVAGKRGEPVLLVHGTAATGEVNFQWAMARALGGDGFAVCWVNYPDRGYGDQQVSAEYVVRAIERMAHASSTRVDVLGHSQGAVLPRWAVRFWPTAARSNVDDLISIAGAHHGTDAIRLGGLLQQNGCTYASTCSPAVWQFDPESRFVTALNSDRETFEENDVTSIYSAFDVMVSPTETAVLDDPDPSSPNVANILLQDLCPGRPTGHATLAFDHVAYQLVRTAFVAPGPADPAVVDATDCLRGPYESIDFAQGLRIALEEYVLGGGADYQPVDREPPLMPYARSWG